MTRPSVAVARSASSAATGSNGALLVSALAAMTSPLNTEIILDISGRVNVKASVQSTAAVSTAKQADDQLFQIATQPVQGQAVRLVQQMPQLRPISNVSSRVPVSLQQLARQVLDFAAPKTQGVAADQKVVQQSQTVAAAPTFYMMQAAAPQQSIVMQAAAQQPQSLVMQTATQPQQHYVVQTATPPQQHFMMQTATQSQQPVVTQTATRSQQPVAMQTTTTQPQQQFFVQTTTQPQQHYALQTTTQPQQHYALQTTTQPQQQYFLQTTTQPQQQYFLQTTTQPQQHYVTQTATQTRQPVVTQTATQSNQPVVVPSAQQYVLHTLQPVSVQTTQGQQVVQADGSQYQVFLNEDFMASNMTNPAITKAFIAGIESVAPNDEVTVEHLVRMLAKMHGPSIDLIVSSKEELKALATELRARGITNRNVSEEAIENTLRLRQQATRNLGRHVVEASVITTAAPSPPPRQSAVQETMASRLVSLLSGRGDTSDIDVSDLSESTDLSESSSSD
eukprot:Blabericola_migrator_1__7356@NODE_373_length_9251_cov_2588_298889_g298_i0_p2_GENE_NODE_373_length_9251_cov_2588_298889_g298_i0NODE_373_length_9251_cov_2588_298889_g298_i0_p2_ORF_typecomplete_len507_score97_54_NODE_373_length_9251_cov_2588_298889_g298_i031324652